jgi:CubicO group peptidase (beta-lactamase class C family)
MFGRRVACLALLVICLSSCAHAPPRSDRDGRLDALLERQARELILPGVSAALVERGQLVWTGAKGWADVDARIPVTPETPFNIASLTKPMTAVLLMQLVERGALSLDTPMQRYDPAFTDARITVGHVLAMRSQGDPPGQQFAYSGEIYGTLGGVVSRVTGETLAQAFSTRLFDPLRLVRTSPGDLTADAQGLGAERRRRYQSIFGRIARPYNMYGGVEPVAAIPPDATPNAAANVISTASDYARFADAVMRRRLLGQATLAVMWTPAVTPSGERLPYAYGWFVKEYHGHRLIWHYGYYDNAYSALALIVPERELVFVALANGSGLSGHSGIGGIEGNVLACAVLVEFVDAALPCAEAAAANVARWRAQIPPARREMTSDPADLKRYAGTYRRPAGGEATVFVDQGRLWWQSSAGRYALTQEAPDRFFMKADNRTMVFVFDDQGRVTRIDVTYPGDPKVYVVPRAD